MPKSVSQLDEMRLTSDRKKPETNISHPDAGVFLKVNAFGDRLLIDGSGNKLLVE